MPVVRRLASRAGHLCSNPGCRRPTSGPESTADGSVNIGVAAHITAASPGGPRFDPNLTHDERSAAANGIWLCQDCAKLIDSDVTRFTRELLLEWKSSAETRAQIQLQTPERPQGADEPALVIPSADPTVAWLPFSARATNLVGRDDELRQLEGFLQSGQRFSWWLLTGPAGTGKSRLALELCYDLMPAWNAGFLSRTDNFTGWSRFRPTRPTLFVVDYVSSRAAQASAMVLELCRSTAYLPFPVRVLLLERERGSWWPLFLREGSQSESAELVACQHDDPLQLGSLTPDALRALGADVARSQHIPWSDSTARAYELRMRTVDPLGRPLFGMLAAAYSEGEAFESAVDSELLRLVLKKEAGRRREAITDTDKLRRVENLIALSTLVGGLLPKSGGFSFLTDTEAAPLLPNPALIDPQAYCDLVAAPCSETLLPGLQPDILGERFLLDRLGRADESSKTLIAAAWTLQPDDFCDFVVRAASDFPGDGALDALCAMPLTSDAARARWGQLVGDLVWVSNRSSDPRNLRLLQTLREMADTHASERGLQTVLARAELYLANILLFSEDDYARAEAQYNVAIARAGTGTEVEVAAINNRGILHNIVRDEDRAFADWSEVIAREGIPDEARACSLNNRADIFARRDAHEDAIRDRSEVLSLKETSPDRRYIALFRRSRSYFALGRVQDALRDLELIQSVEDISPQQKAEARLARGELFRMLGRLVEARHDFDSVLAAEEVFPGTIPSTFVELAELARIERDGSRAREYLDQALAAPDVDDSTLVESIIVRARLLMDEGDEPGAESLWQSVMTHPEASRWQKLIAENRGSAPHSSTQPSTT